MRRWKNALLPLLTMLTVLCLSLLPPRLSEARDRGLLGAVHAEELGEDSNFPFRPPPLSGRIWLAAQMQDWPESLVRVHQELEGAELERAGTAALAEMQALKDLGILPEGLQGEDAVLYGSRSYLRDRTDLASADFLDIQFEWGKANTYLRLLLDGESGKTLALNCVSPENRKQPLDMESLGQAFLERLELDSSWEETDMSKQYAAFRLPESHAVYIFILDGITLLVAPQVDWSSIELDDEGRLKDLEAYGITVDGISGAAVPQGSTG